MRDMIEDRFDDIGAAITNSRRDIALDAIQDGDRRRKEKEPELEEVLGKGDDDEMDNDVDEEKSTSSSPGTARRPSPHLNVERLAGTYRLGTPLRPATPPFGVSGPSCCRSGVMSGLTEELEKVGAFMNERKPLHNVEVEETKNLEIKEKFGTEKDVWT
ncbi:hypothetical protein MMC22_003617 [Lobaria immixta]|nr:hypothetical protein [Lobaria immixta]